LKPVFKHGAVEDFEMPDNAFDRYLELVGKVDSFSNSVMRSMSGDIACRPGCDECCMKSFTVFRVEAANLYAGFLLLEPAARRVILQRCGSSDPHLTSCVLLDSGRCMLYAHRPIICRTHGLPLKSERLYINGSPRTALCHKNFTEPGSLSRLPKELVLDLDTLNTMLSAVNMLFMKELSGGPGPGEGERVSFPDIFRK